MPLWRIRPTRAGMSSAAEARLARTLVRVERVFTYRVFVAAVRSQRALIHFCVTYYRSRLVVANGENTAMKLAEEYNDEEIKPWKDQSSTRMI